MKLFWVTTIVIGFLILLLPASSAGMQQNGLESTVMADTVTVRVVGTHADSRFEPSDLQVQTGTVIRFEVAEGLHTVTAYHPSNRRALGIPEEAEPFDSGPLKAGDVWTLRISVDGAYNFFCLPHERMGHTGRIVAVTASQ
ncbi:MAG: plastocyanin/azurin family copper-binding protein [Balneolaceae bacterium]